MSTPGSSIMSIAGGGQPGASTQAPSSSTQPGASILTVAQADTTNPSPNGLTPPPQQPGFLSSVWNDALSTGKGVIQQASAPAAHLYNVAVSLAHGDYAGAADHFEKFAQGPEGDIADSVLQSSGQAAKRMVTSAKQGDVLGALQHGVGIVPGASQVDAAMTNYQSNPSRENLAHVITNALPFLIPGALKAVGSGVDTLAGKLPGVTAGTEEAAQAAEAKPGIVKQVFQGEKVAQAPAKAALRTGASASAADAGVEAGSQGGSIRSLLDDPIEALSKNERASYDAINKASGTDLKSLYDYAEELQDNIDDPTQIANRNSLKTELKTTQDSITKGEAQAVKNGVDPDTLNDAKDMTKQRYAMENINQKLFANTSVVKGNIAHGAPETINVNSAIDQVEKLDQPSKFAPRGTPSRLQQAFGEDGAQALKQSLYDAQKAGQSALSKQVWAKRLTALAGTTGVGYEVLKGIFQ